MESGIHSIETRIKDLLGVYRTWGGRDALYVIRKCSETSIERTPSGPSQVSA